MIRKSILIALAATATLGAASLASTSANAYIHGPGFRGHPGGFVHPVPRRPWYGHNHYWRRPVVWYAPRPIYAAAPIAAVAAPIASKCSCLTKEYTPEGAVLFKDTCTNEMAMNPPEQQQQQQTGMVQQPQQPQAQAYVPQYPPQSTR